MKKSPKQKPAREWNGIIADWLVEASRHSIAAQAYTIAQALGAYAQVTPASAWLIADKFLEHPTTVAHLAKYAAFERETLDKIQAEVGGMDRRHAVPARKPRRGEPGYVSKAQAKKLQRAALCDR